MDDFLVEIIFKCVPLKSLEPLLKKLSIHGQEVIDYTLTTGAEVAWGVGGSIEKVFKTNKNFGFFINLKSLIQDEIQLSNCGICIYKYEEAIDLEINFQLVDVKKTDHLSEKLMNFCKHIASEYQIKQYLCGIEPAEDVDMRLFTNEKFGPLKFDDQGELYRSKNM